MLQRRDGLTFLSLMNVQEPEDQGVPEVDRRYCLDGAGVEETAAGGVSIAHMWCGSWTDQWIGVSPRLLTRGIRLLDDQTDPIAMM